MKTYNTPVLSIRELTIEDILTTSLTAFGHKESGMGDSFDWSQF